MFFKFMPLHNNVFKRLVIATLALTLAGCSLITLGYGRLPMLAQWRLDAMFELTSVQSQQVRPELNRWLAWHRQAHLPQYAAMLQRWQTLAMQDLTPQQVCAEFEPIRLWADEAVQQLLPALVPIATSLTSAQIEHWGRYQARKDEEFLAEFGNTANGTANSNGVNANGVNAKRLQRAIERAEMFYGPLNSAQRDWLAQRLARSTFDAQRVVQERQRRQADAQDAVQRIQAGANPLLALQQVWQRNQQSPNPAYAAYSQRMVQDGCVQLAELHNQTTPEQRRRAVQKLQGFERDVLGLAGRI
jgi:hypothetical protein